MSIFTNDKDLQAKFDASQAEVAEHEATIAEREASIVTLTEDLAASNVKATESEDSIVALTAQLEKEESDSASIKAELEESQGKQEDFDGKVNAAALAKVQELGLSAPVHAGSSDDDSNSEMTREAFSELSPSAKSEFSKSGGLIK